MSARRYRLLCNGKQPGRLLTADQARLELTHIPDDSDVHGNLTTGVSWTGWSAYLPTGQVRHFTLTPIDEDA